MLHDAAERRRRGIFVVISEGNISATVSVLSQPKIVIVGAGFAGLGAAVALRELGLASEIVEARERLGGRTWTRPFGQRGPRVEYGGTWFMPEHRRVRRELQRAGSEVREHLPTAWRWRTAEELRHGLPVPRGEWPRLEAALVRLVADADALGGGASRTGDASGPGGTSGGGADDVGSLSFAAYLERLDTTPAVRDFLHGWWAVTGGTDPSEGAAIDGLAAIADHGGLLGVSETLRRSPALGWEAIAQAMAAHARAPVRYGCQLVHVDTAETVTPHLVGGERLQAQAAILALPLNVLADISFAPALPQRVASSLGKNRGRAVKMWLSARGIPPRSLAAGRGRGLDLLLHDRSLDGTELAVGFGPASDRFDPRNGRDVQAALQAFYPEAELVAFDSHDWNTDPFARGTWATAPGGEPDALDHARFAPIGPLAFASSDFAPEAAGWIEGAIAAGEAAAAAVAGLPNAGRAAVDARRGGADHGQSAGASQPRG